MIIIIIIIIIIIMIIIIIIIIINWCLLVTHTRSAGAELRRAQLNRTGRMHLKSASMATARRSCMIPGHSIRARFF